ncbi:MAG: nicotinamide mononucleotide transporter [Rhizobacter sp.]
MTELLWSLKAWLELPVSLGTQLTSSRLELLGFVLALVMVVCNIRVNPWAWPLAIISSLVYALVFWQSKLYGESGLQLFFVAMALWGWWQWLRRGQAQGNLCKTRRGCRAFGSGWAARRVLQPIAQLLARNGAPQTARDRTIRRREGFCGGSPGLTLVVRPLKPELRLWVLASFLVLWLALAQLLDHRTDTDVPWWDAAATAGSIVGTWLLGRKHVENWPVWVAVNAVSIGLFIYKGLWLTCGLYAVLLALALVGWRAWHRLAIQEGT